MLLAVEPRILLSCFPDFLLCVPVIFVSAAGSAYILLRSFLPRNCCGCLNRKKAYPEGKCYRVLQVVARRDMVSVVSWIVRAPRPATCFMLQVSR